MELEECVVNFSVRQDVVVEVTQIIFNHLRHSELSPMEMALAMRSVFEFCRSKMSEASPDTPGLVFDSLIGSAIFGESTLRKIQAVNFEREKGLLNSLTGGSIH